MLPTSAAELTCASSMQSHATPIAPALVLMPLPNASSLHRRVHFSFPFEPHPAVVAFGSGRLVQGEWTPAAPAGVQGKRARGVAETRRSISVEQIGQIAARKFASLNGEKTSDGRLWEFAA